MNTEHSGGPTVSGGPNTESTESTESTIDDEQILARSDAYFVMQEFFVTTAGVPIADELAKATRALQSIAQSLSSLTLMSKSKRSSSSKSKAAKRSRRASKFESNTSQNVIMSPPDSGAPPPTEAFRFKPASTPVGG
jgi:hypothetical protein